MRLPGSTAPRSWAIASSIRSCDRARSAKEASQRPDGKRPGHLPEQVFVAAAGQEQAFQAVELARGQAIGEVVEQLGQALRALRELARRISGDPFGIKGIAAAAAFAGQRRRNLRVAELARQYRGCDVRDRAGIRRRQQMK